MSLAFAPPFGPNLELTSTHSVRLTNHIYAEHLMDRDHYLDWLLDSLEKSPQSKLPIWVLIVQIYWKDMLRLRRTARKLVVVLLHHLHEVRCPDGFLHGYMSVPELTRLCRFKITPTGTYSPPYLPVWPPSSRA